MARGHQCLERKFGKCHLMPTMFLWLKAAPAVEAQHAEGHPNDSSRYSALHFDDDLATAYALPGKAGYRVRGWSVQHAFHL